jgi:hypothetical protein
MSERIDTSRPDVAAPDPMPWWQELACPAWCGGGHSKSEMPEDRKHWGEELRLDQLNLMPLMCLGTPDAAPSHVSVYLSQHVREIDARVVLSVNDGPAVLTLTTGEAVWLRNQLSELVSAAAVAFLDRHDRG